MHWEKEEGIYKLITKADNYNDMYGFILFQMTMKKKNIRFC